MSFPFRLGILVKWCRTFCHMIKVKKYHVTKCPSRSLGARIQCRDSMSEPGNEWMSLATGTFCHVIVYHLNHVTKTSYTTSQRFWDGIESSYLNIIFWPWKRKILVWNTIWQDQGTTFSLTTPFSNLKSYGNRVFPFCAPKLSNSSPTEIRNCTSVDI